MFYYSHLLPACNRHHKLTTAATERPLWALATRKVRTALTAAILLLSQNATALVILDFVADPNGFVDIEVTDGIIRVIGLTTQIDLIAGESYEINIVFPDNLALHVLPSQGGPEDVGLDFFGGIDALPGGVTGTMDLSGVSGDFTGILPLAVAPFFFPPSDFVIGQESSLTDNGFSFRDAHFSFTLAEDFTSYTADFMNMIVLGGGFEVVTAVSVDIDIKPGSDPNGINPRKKGVIAVAILGSSDFDATQVDVTTVEFGPDSAAPVHDGHIEDVNTDGHPDFVVHFKTPDTGIACGDTDATLIGSTGDNPFIGMDSVKTAGCPAPVVAEYVNDFSSSVGPASLFGDAVLDSGSVRLTDSINDQIGSFVIDELVAGGAVASFAATFNLQTGPGSSPPADGISFNLGPLSNSTFGEEGAGGGLTISFDTFDNLAPDAIAIDVLVNGALVSRNFTNPFTNGVFVPVSVVFDADGTLDLTFDGAAIFTNLPTGFTPATGDRFGFGGRTGGSNEVNRIDNVSIVVVPQ